MDLKEATKILNNLVMYCRFNEEKNYTDEQLFNAIEYFAFNKFIPVEKIEDKLNKLKGNIPYLSKFNDWKEKDYTNEDILENIIQVLQELLEDK